MCSPIQILQDLYDSEINFRISSFWDAGYEACLGDDMNGLDVIGDFRTIDQAVDAIKDRAIRIFPESTFAKKYGTVT